MIVPHINTRALLILLTIFVLGLLSVVPMMFLVHAIKFTSMGFATQSEFQKVNDVYIPLITTIFDKAETANMRNEIDEKYNAILGYPTQNGTYEGREPSYFIRLKGDKLQKLFQSGDLKNEVVDTKGEEEVVEMLQGKRNPITFPQYTCCGGDDIFPEMPILRDILPERRYLKDFPSELETILLIRDGGGSILGAKVLLYGD